LGNLQESLADLGLWQTLPPAVLSDIAHKFFLCGKSAPGTDPVGLAQRYENGESVPRDYQRALALYCQAAQRGDSRAFFNIGWMFLNGRGVARDEAAAVMWLRKAAAHGVPQAVNLLGLLSRATPSAARQGAMPSRGSPRAASRTRARAASKCI